MAARSLSWAASDKRLPVRVVAVAERPRASTSRAGRVPRRVVLHVDAQSPELAIQGDPDKLTQIFLNVLLNAVQFSPEGGRIEVCCQERSLPHGRFAVVSILDQGPGIAPADRERIFDPFFSTRENGTGLGLAIASRLMDEHRGYVEVASPPGKGAEFLLLFPLAPAR